MSIATRLLDVRDLQSFPVLVPYKNGVASTRNRL